MLDLLPLVHKTVPFKFKGAELRLDLSHALFSSFDVDAGTRLLLKAVGRDEVLARSARILDEGSGVGVIGIAMAKAFPEARVVARDRDLLARAFTERNRKLNKVSNLEALPGLLASGDSGQEPFGYILSNIPAKAGGPVIEAFFAWSRERLLPGGRLAVVIVKPLAELAKAALAAAGFSLVAEERGGMHSVYVGEKATVGGSQAAAPVASAASVAATAATAATAADAGAALPGPLLSLAGFGLGVYRRTEQVFRRKDESWRARGWWGLPDFDQLGFAPSLASDLLDPAVRGLLVRDALVVNPEAGHIPILIGRRIRPDRLDAAGRDLLALAATGENLDWSLAAPGAPSPPAYRALDLLRLDELPAAGYDLIVEFPDIEPAYDWIAPFWERILHLLKRGGSLLVVLPPTEWQRLEKRRPSGFTLRIEKKRKGFQAAVYRRD
jgi:16S rRNA (guanine1207-N2)-methyltransferase